MSAAAPANLRSAISDKIATASSFGLGSAASDYNSFAESAVLSSAGYEIVSCAASSVFPLLILFCALILLVPSLVKSSHPIGYTSTHVKWIGIPVTSGVCAI